MGLSLSKSIKDKIGRLPPVAFGHPDNELSGPPLGAFI
jgi:hypothetical protein